MSSALPSPPTDESAWVTVDLAAISDNVRVLCDAAAAGRAPDGSRGSNGSGGTPAVMAVVKADGYGHGLVPTAIAALDGGATWLGVAQLSEALALRGAAVDAPILSWLHAPGADFEAALLADIDLGVSTGWACEAIAAAARRTGRTARLHLKADTGLGRNGAYVKTQAWPDLVRRARALELEGTVRVVGVFSHFAYADEPAHPTVRAQQEAFESVVLDCEAAGFELEVRHLANSAATLTNPSAAYDLVRPGLAIYGLSPVPDLGSPASFGLRPAMTLSTRISQVKELPAGQGVSYAHQYASATDTSYALLPLGYADGLPRAASNVGPVWIGGQRRAISGRVCMDQVVVDVGTDPRVREGDIAVLFGPGDRGEPTAQEWALATGTISYEIVTRISARLARVYVEGSRA